jgi:hypothetical protein
VPRALMRNCVIYHPTVLARKQLFDEFGGYRQFVAASDYDLWLRMSSKGIRFHQIREPLVGYRIRSSGISGSKGVAQLASATYARYLCVARSLVGSDSFSESSYAEFIERFGGLTCDARLARIRGILEQSITRCRIAQIAVRARIVLIDAGFRRYYSSGLLCRLAWTLRGRRRAVRERCLRKVPNT